MPWAGLDARATDDEVGKCPEMVEEPGANSLLLYVLPMMRVNSSRDISTAVLSALPDSSRDKGLTLPPGSGSDGIENHAGR